MSLSVIDVIAACIFICVVKNGNLMLEVPDARGEQNHVVLVATFNGVAISYAPTWMDNCLHTCLASLFYRITYWGIWK